MWVLELAQDYNNAKQDLCGWSKLVLIDQEYRNPGGICGGSIISALFVIVFELFSVRREYKTKEIRTNVINEAYIAQIEILGWLLPQYPSHCQLK